MKKITLTVLALSMSFSLLSCGYTTRSALPGKFRMVHVLDFANKIDFTDESRKTSYFPLLEVNIRDAIVDRFLFDGNLRISDMDRADLILEGELINYERVALRYTDDDEVQEYRLQIIVNIKMIDAETDEPLWAENGFAGEATYFIEGPLVTTEQSAVQEATLDLARRVIERTVEDW